MLADCHAHLLQCVLCVDQGRLALALLIGRDSNTGAEHTFNQCLQQRQSALVPNMNLHPSDVFVALPEGGLGLRKTLSQSLFLRCV